MFAANRLLVKTEINDCLKKLFLEKVSIIEYQFDCFHFRGIKIGISKRAINVCVLDWRGSQSTCPLLKFRVLI